MNPVPPGNEDGGGDRHACPETISRTRPGGKKSDPQATPFSVPTLPIRSRRELRSPSVEFREAFGTVSHGLQLAFVADDFGRDAPVNQAILHAHRHGALTGASLMMGQEERRKRLNWRGPPRSRTRVAPASL